MRALYSLILDLACEALEYNTLVGLIMDNLVSRHDAECAIADLLNSGRIVRRGAKLETR